MEVGGTEKAALVLAGAVAKGAFEAGVTSELATRGIVFDRFVGTSAGALSATLLAAGAAVGRFEYAARKLEELWRDRAWVWSFLNPTLALGGISSTRRVESMVVEALRDVVVHAGPRPASLHRTKLTLVTTDLCGSVDQGELTHEDEHEYREAALVDERRWKEIASVAAASAAFPILFSPAKLTAPNGVRGRRVDGGVVNNTPLSYAIDKDDGKSGRNSIIVVSAEPNVPRRPTTLWLFPLGLRLIDILINERIGRDLVVARKRNDKRTELISELKGHEDIDAGALADRLGFRELDILAIHPREELVGGAFGGFFWKPWRAEQIAEGKLAAHTAFAARDAPFPKPAASPAPLAAPHRHALGEAPA